MGKKSSQPLEVFYCYAREDHTLREELDKHLAILRRSGFITPWYDGEIVAGAPWEKAIEDHLNTADMILLLVSPDFLHSDYCYSREMKHAIKRHRAGNARVIPVLLRPVDWAGAPFSVLQGLPSDARPVTLWPDRDEALEDVAKGIRRVVEELRQSQLTFRKGWLVWIITLLFVLAGAIQITCLLLGWESPWSIAATILAALIAVMMLIQLNPTLPYWPLSKSSPLFIKVAGHQLLQRVILILLVIAIIAFPAFALLSHISSSTTQVSRLEFPPPPGTPPSGNLLTNSGFEQGKAKWDWIAGSNVQMHQGGGKSWVEVNIVLPDTESICSQQVHVKPQVGKSYTASLLIRAATTTPIAGELTLWMLDDDAPDKHANNFTTFIVTSSKWTPVTTTFHVSQSWYTSMTIQLYIHTHGDMSLMLAEAQLIQDS